jgi:hypothetical protein
MIEKLNYWRRKIKLLTGFATVENLFRFLEYRLDRTVLLTRIVTGVGHISQQILLEGER